MKMADILRKLADVIDSADDTDNTASDYDNNGQLDPHERDHAEEKPLLKTLDRDNDGDHDMDDHNAEEPKVTGKFMPPNQQKLELLKKGVGVESEYDSDDELTAIKKNAGISPAVVHIASDDEPME
jgi:hypothetical protein